jgi:hypothetical protein
MPRLTVLKCPGTEEGRSSGKVFPERPTMIPVRMARFVSVVLLELETFVPEDNGVKVVQCQSITFDDLLSYWFWRRARPQLTEQVLCDKWCKLFLVLGEFQVSIINLTFILSEMKYF